MSLLDKLPEQHRLKLSWFLENRNKVVLWEDTKPEKNKIPGKPFLFTQAKGIYKPKEDKYALSIRVMLDSKYPDEEILHRHDGSWSFRYHQEENDGKSPNDLATNKGLIACMQDDIPIGVAIQKNAKPGASYKILGLAQVTEINDGFFLINGYSDDGKVTKTRSYGPYSEELEQIEFSEFDPKTQKDARAKLLIEVVQRQGQRKFRESLLRLYKSKCVISKCNIPAVLEAAHITPYLGTDTNKISNGLILRADVHTLWDLALIAINPHDMRVHLSPALEGSEYDKFNNQIIKFNGNEKPSKKALEFQWDSFLNKLDN